MNDDTRKRLARALHVMIVVMLAVIMIALCISAASGYTLTGQINESTTWQLTGTTVSVDVEPYGRDDTYVYKFVTGSGTSTAQLRDPYVPFDYLAYTPISATGGYSIQLDDGAGSTALLTAPTAAAGWSARRNHAAAVFDGKLWVMGAVGKNDVWYSEDGVTWVQATAAAGWSARHSHTAAVFDGKLWVMGGTELSSKNDVWYSEDGVTWVQATAAAGWSGRYGHTAAVFDGKLWVMGGTELSSKNDVWYSEDGVTWVQATAAAGWSGRYDHTAAVFDGKLWVMGGYDGALKNDVWYSEDGVTWVQATAAAGWSARREHAAAVFDGKLWVMGGGGKNDVWYSEDGVTWVQATAAAGWSGRYGHTAAVFDGKLWVMGGTELSSKNDVWYSEDGVTWVQATAAAGWSGRYGHTAAVFDGKLWVMGGYDGALKNDVWYSEDGVTWVDIISHMRFEYIKAGSAWKVYRNGAELSSVAYSPTPIYWGVRTTNTGTIRIDDIVATTVLPYVLGGLPEDWYILNDPGFTPGVYDPDGNYKSDDFLITWGWHTSAYKGDLRYADRIVLQHFRSGQAIHTYDLNPSYPVGSVTVNAIETFTDAPVPFGMYSAKLYGSDGTLARIEWFVYTPVKLAGDHITWDRREYFSHDTATVNTTITTPDFANYNYGGAVYDIYGTRHTSWSITGFPNSRTVTIEGWDPGVYFAVLELTDKSTGDTYEILYDIAEITEAVGIEGTVYDIETGSGIDAADIALHQAASWHNTTSEATGEYSLDDLVTNYPITYYAEKAGYTHTPFAHTPLAAKIYTMDLYLIPDPLNYTGTAVAGQVYSSHNHQAIPGATVNLTINSTTHQTTTSSTGYFLFDDLPGDHPDTYTIQATKPGYPDSEILAGSTENASITYQEIPITGRYTLTVELWDRLETFPISETMTVLLDGGTRTTSVDGVATFYNLEVGVYVVQVGSTSTYYGASQAVIVEDDTTTRVYLTKIGETGDGGAGVRYPPHNVKFILRDAWGAPIEGVVVTATATETTGLWAWLKDWLGIAEEVDIQETVMEGTTGTDGAINFMMIEAVKYRVTFVKEGVIDTAWEGYPKDDYYVIWAPRDGQWFRDGYNPLEVINVTIAATATQSNAEITVFYNDTLAQTTQAKIYLNQTFANGTELATGSHTATSSAFSHTFNLTGDHRGESYRIRVIATHGTFGTHERTAGVFFKPGPTSLGLPEDILLFLAMGLLIFTGLFFGQSSVPAGAVVIAFQSWIFFWLGWWQDLGSDIAVGGVCTFVTVFAAATVIMHRSKRERYA